MVADSRPEFHGADPTRMRRTIVFVLVLTVLLVTSAVFFGSLRFFERQVQADAENRLSLYQRSLNEALRQHQHLPYILARSEELRAAFSGVSTDEVNETLRRFADEAKLEAIYVMDTTGLVVASSNSGETYSFVGQNYGFRPYFQNALNGNRSDYFAIGATSGRPGYFVAEPMSDSNGTPIGVMAIKLDVSELQASWESGGDHVFAVNGDGIVVLSSIPDWLYQTLNDLPEATRESIRGSRQFGNEPLERLDATQVSRGTLAVDGRTYLVASGASDWRGWTVYLLQPEASVLRQTLVATGLLGTLIAILIGFATYLRSQRIAAALEVSQNHRRDLIATNARLQETQDELKRTSKLAALGQLAASVTHELGQPISALKTHLAAAELGNEITSRETSDNLKRLADRMDSITGQLRFFAREGARELEPALLQQCIQESLALVQHDLESGSVELEVDVDPDLLVEAQRIQLEQAFVNLIRNAVQALEGTHHPKIVIRAKQANGWAQITITDNGPGLGGASIDQLQEPFFSTKPSGVGMGLGLSITAEIIVSHGGELSVSDSNSGGAEFIVTLPLVERGKP
ncbi:MAG: cache domain-containing protein [Boseongicola sp.]|nr:cache domain-containing protein [Boseongicola sp.]MDD9977419.1 cache domain-containing protein [Boseongicola sp.]